MTANQFKGSIADARFVQTEVLDGVAWIRLHRPAVRNAVNPVMIHLLDQALGRALADPAVAGIVLSGTGTCFAIGADVSFFQRHVIARQFDRIELFSRSIHQLCGRIASAPKPVVAALSGAALGVGLELALACHRIVATRTATLGLPEVGLGICPGGGGTQRTPRRIGLGLAKWLIYSGSLLSGTRALAVRLVDACVAEGDLQRVAQELAIRPPDTGSVTAPPPIASEYMALEQVFACYSVVELLALAQQATVPAGLDEHTWRATKTLLKQPQGALQLAERLIDTGWPLPLPEALELETAAQRTMFDSDEARQRLGAARIS